MHAGTATNQELKQMNIPQLLAGITPLKINGAITKKIVPKNPVKNSVALIALSSVIVIYTTLAIETTAVVTIPTTVRNTNHSTIAVNMSPP